MERSYKVALCIYHQVLIKRKEVIKLRYVYTSSRVNQKEKKLLGCSMYVSSRVHQKKRSYQVRYVYIVTF